MAGTISTVCTDGPRLRRGEGRPDDVAPQHLRVTAGKGRPAMMLPMIPALRPRMPRRNGAGIELLADPTRRRIIALLAVHPLRPSTIASEVCLSRPAVSRQLRLLRQAGLIVATRSRVDGRAVLYGIHPSRHGSITAWLAGTSVGRPGRLRIGEDGRVHEG
jgi:DNA-binding transcriptional ArsR family regulator